MDDSNNNGNKTNQDLQAEVIRDYAKVCICKSITRKTMKKVIKEGATTLEQVRYKTSAGSGPCKGRRCTPRIEELLKEYEAGMF